MSDKYKEYSKLDMPAIEQATQANWKEQDTFRKSVEQRNGQQEFVFYEGPPSANGMPGIHHVISRTLKDLVCRFKTMQGYQVKRKAGWDTHGLPVELGVEKELGITKEDIGKKISVEDYNQKCREAVMRYKGEWESITEKMGYWVDMSDPYVTFDNKYIETLWWALKELHKKGYLYKSVSIQPYSPAAGTGLSSHELNQPGTYKDVKDTTAVAMFKAVKGDKTQMLFDAAGSDEVYFMAWTTTPWTLPSNCGLTVGPKIDYVLLPATNPYTNDKVHVVLAEKLIGKVFSRELLEQLFIVDLMGGRLGEKTDRFDGYVPDNLGGEFLVEVKTSLRDKSSLDNFCLELKKQALSKGGYFCTLEPVSDKIQDEYPDIRFLTLDDFGDKIVRFKGEDIVDARYEQLMPYEGNTAAIAGGDPFRVISGDFVTTEDGTGIVHTAPAFGADDFKVGKQANIGILTLVDKEGKFVENLGNLSGRFVKNYKDDDEYVDVNVDIAVDLKLRGQAFKVEKYEHSYPHCWRTDKPIVYYPLDAWFIKTTAVKDRMIELNKTINWKPAATGSGRFGNWLENMVDWNLSRSRYWGTPLPVWVSEDGEQVKCIGSIEELMKELRHADKALNLNQAAVYDQDVEKLDLHKPTVDQLVLATDDGKQSMTREPDLIDVWFDSGAMPYAQWHYPFENKDIQGNQFPADFIAEGVDQTRGWFYTLHALGVMLFDSVAYKTVVSNGLVLDKKGNKMSKRVGNVIDPFETIEKYSADATRWYLITNASPWDSMKFDLAGIQEVQRKFFGTLYNTYQFFALYANVDGFNFSEDYIPVKERPEIDRWILSELNTLVGKVNDYFNDYEPTQAGRAIEYFLDEQLSNWYVRLCRRRFWKGEYEQDKISAYQTLYECLETMSLLMAPIAPFFADWMFQNLNGITKRHKEESVHLAVYPHVNKEAVDTDLEERMQLAQDITSLVLSIRKKVNIKVRQPLTKVLIPVLNKHMQEQIEQIEDLIKNEVNVKGVEYLLDTEGFIKKKVKPNFKTLGARMGKKMKMVAAAIGQLADADITKLEKEKTYALTIDGEVIDISVDDVEIIAEDIPGWSVANKDALTVALDITITPVLENEGNARELVNRIQRIRKESGLELTDRINVQVEEQDLLKSAIINFKDYICTEILADNIELLPQVQAGTDIEVGDTSFKVLISKN